MQKLEYLSPFVDAHVDHDSDDRMFCLSRANSDDPVLETFLDTAASAVVLADQSIGMAFYCGRHAAELALKAFLPEAVRADHRYSHNLAKMLNTLPSGDDLLGNGIDQQLIARFIQDLHRLDPGGDQGRYPTTGRADTLSLIDVCHANTDRFVEQVNRLAHYTELRLRGRSHVPLARYW